MVNTFTVPSRILTWLALAFLAAWLIPALASAEIQTVGSLDDGVFTGGDGSYAPQISQDGQFILFLSHARNLADSNTASDRLNVYLAYPSDHKITLISGGLNGMPANGAAGPASVSSNGLFVAFESSSSNLVVNDTNGFRDIFLRDVTNGVTILVTAGLNGSGANGDSRNPLISPDGRFVLFESVATNLVAGDTNRTTDFFLWDRSTGSNVLISTGAGSVASFPTMSGDAQRVAFCARSLDYLGFQPAFGINEPFVRDVKTGNLLWANTNLASTVGSPYDCFLPVLSENGERVFFKVRGYYGAIFLCAHTLSNSTTLVLSTNTSSLSLPAVDWRGHFVAAEEGTNIWRWDVNSGVKVLVDINLSGTGPGNGKSFQPVLSRDGAHVAFLSEATDLTPNSCDGRAQLFVRDLTTGKTTLISADRDGRGVGDLSLCVPSFDATGSIIAFDCPEDNLTPGDRNGASDVFATWTDFPSPSLMSRRFYQKPHTLGHAARFGGLNSVSGDGRYVAFTSMDTNAYYPARTNNFNPVVWDTLQNTNVISRLLTNSLLETGIGVFPPIISDTGNKVAYILQTYDAFPAPSPARLQTIDLQTGVPIIVASGTNQPYFSFDGKSLSPSMSADGRFIAYQTDATNFSQLPDNNKGLDIFVYDSVQGTNIPVSLKLSGNGFGNSPSRDPFISKDGRWVLFQSTATDLVTNTLPSSDANFYFARDLILGKTHYIPRLPGYIPNTQSVTRTNAVISQNGEFAFFETRSSGSTLVEGYHLLSKTNFLVCTNCLSPTPNSNGQTIAYLVPKTTNVRQTDIYVKDRSTGKEYLLTPGIDGLSSNGRCKDLCVSPDGRSIVFASTASNLVPGDQNGLSDIVIRDRLLGTTTLLSVNRQGTGPGFAASFLPVMSADGKTVVFQSFAGDLVEGDYNNFRDLFVARLGGVDSDHDGLDDDWEVAFFGDLSRSGAGDFDGDGYTDAQEFVAGTDPKNNGSVLRAMTVSGINSGVVTILWNSVPGKTYRIQFKDDLKSTGWNDLAGLVVATSATASKQDTQAQPQRYYRVVAGGE